MFSCPLPPILQIPPGFYTLCPHGIGYCHSCSLSENIYSIIFGLRHLIKRQSQNSCTFEDMGLIKIFKVWIWFNQAHEIKKNMQWVIEEESRIERIPEKFCSVTISLDEDAIIDHVQGMENDDDEEEEVEDREDKGGRTKQVT
ncbi:hypothetical protein AVEN_93211-1 [Araneus ventricosus]|uniref:Uncharacterized protein n=1 Tax=Araneus ventricosus TaxID=182803 RepID=A0A4Y2LF39_ARAVE|nr:hypothetical protein AVEN_93211-1 [Araneus ventricosus]